MVPQKSAIFPNHLIKIYYEKFDPQCSLYVRWRITPEDATEGIRRRKVAWAADLDPCVRVDRRKTAGAKKRETKGKSSTGMQRCPWSDGFLIGSSGTKTLILRKRVGGRHPRTSL